MPLFNTPVCVAVDHKYSDNNGSWSEFIFFDGQGFTTKGGMYSNLAYNSYQVNATVKQLRKASIIALKQAPEGYSYNRYAGNGGTDTYVNCIVKLKRSRKAPNNTELKVIDWFDGGYNGQYNNYTPDQICVTDGSQSWTVSASCIDEVVKGVKELPFWYISQEEADHMIKEAVKARAEKALKSHLKTITNRGTQILSNLAKSDKKAADALTVDEILTILNPTPAQADKIEAFKTKYNI